LSDEPPTILPIPPGPFIYLYTHKSIKMEDFDDFSYTLKKVKR